LFWENFDRIQMIAHDWMGSAYIGLKSRQNWRVNSCAIIDRARSAKISYFGVSWATGIFQWEFGLACPNYIQIIWPFGRGCLRLLLSLS
jgi:hypothetical protein